LAPLRRWLPWPIQAGPITEQPCSILTLDPIYTGPTIFEVPPLDRGIRPDPDSRLDLLAGHAHLGDFTAH
jgi:hypothetical protein